jgi:hypothetical protein
MRNNHNPLQYTRCDRSTSSSSAPCVWFRNSRTQSWPCPETGVISQRVGELQRQVEPGCFVSHRLSSVLDFEQTERIITSNYSSVSVEVLEMCFAFDYSVGLGGHSFSMMVVAFLLLLLQFLVLLVSPEAWILLFAFLDRFLVWLKSRVLLFRNVPRCPQIQEFRVLHLPRVVTSTPRDPKREKRKQIQSVRRRASHSQAVELKKQPTENVLVSIQWSISGPRRPTPLRQIPTNYPMSILGSLFLLFSTCCDIRFRCDNCDSNDLRLLMLPDIRVRSSNVFCDVMRCDTMIMQWMTGLLRETRKGGLCERGRNE